MKISSLRIAAISVAILLPFMSSCKKEESKGESTGGKITGIALSKTELGLSKNGTFQLVATLLPPGNEGQIVVWSSSNTDVATVSGGLVTAVSDGKATITAQPLENLMDPDPAKAIIIATCQVIVETIQVRELHFTSDTYNIALTAGSFQLEPTVVPEAANKPGVLKYEVVSGADKISVSESGLVTLKAIGTGVVKVSTTDGSELSLNLTFNVQEADIWPTSITYDYRQDMKVGDKQRVRIVYHPETANRKVLNELVFTTAPVGYVKMTKISDEEVELEALKSVDGTSYEQYGVQLIIGFVKGYDESGNPKYGTGPMSYVWTHTESPVVHVSADQVTPWGKLSDGMVVGETFDLQVEVENMHTKQLEYEVNDPNVLSVDENGCITALGRGLSGIEVRTPDHKSSSTIRVEVFGKPASVTANLSELWVRYHSTGEAQFTIKDAQGKQSRQAVIVSSSSLPVTIDPVVDNYKGNYAGISFRSIRSSASDTKKGSAVVSALGYNSVNTSIDVYDAMYDAYDIKPFDGIKFVSGGITFLDGGYRGSGYFEDVSASIHDDFKNCKALVVWTGSRSSKWPNTRLSLPGQRKTTSRDKVNGLAISSRNAGSESKWEEAKSSVVQKNQYYVNAPVWGGGEVINTYDNWGYGYEITAAMKYYNANRASDYQVQPVKNLDNYTAVPGSQTTGWYVPTSAEWYWALSCLGTGSTLAQGAEKISYYIGEWMEADPIVKLTDDTPYYFWSCQEVPDSDNPGDAVNGMAINIKGNTATPAGSDPGRRVTKQNSYKTRGFFAF